MSFTPAFFRRYLVSTHSGPTTAPVISKTDEVPARVELTFNNTQVNKILSLRIPDGGGCYEGNGRSDDRVSTWWAYSLGTVLSMWKSLHKGCVSHNEGRIGIKSRNFRKTRTHVMGASQPGGKGLIAQVTSVQSQGPL